MLGCNLYGNQVIQKQLQPMHTCESEQDGIEIAIAQFADARWNIASDITT